MPVPACAWRSPYLSPRPRVPCRCECALTSARARRASSLLVSANVLSDFAHQCQRECALTCAPPFAVAAAQSPHYRADHLHASGAHVSRIWLPVCPVSPRSMVPRVQSLCDVLSLPCAPASAHSWLHLHLAILHGALVARPSSCMLRCPNSPVALLAYRCFPVPTVLRHPLHFGALYPSRFVCTHSRVPRARVSPSSCLRGSFRPPGCSRSCPRPSSDRFKNCRCPTSICVLFGELRHDILRFRTLHPCRASSTSTSAICANAGALASTCISTSRLFLVRSPPHVIGVLPACAVPPRGASVSTPARCARPPLLLSSNAHSTSSLGQHLRRCLGVPSAA